MGFTFCIRSQKREALLIWNFNMMLLNNTAFRINWVCVNRTMDDWDILFQVRKNEKEVCVKRAQGTSDHAEKSWRMAGNRIFSPRFLHFEMSCKSYQGCLICVHSRTVLFFIHYSHIWLIFSGKLPIFTSILIIFMHEVRLNAISCHFLDNLWGIRA